MKAVPRALLAALIGVGGLWADDLPYDGDCRAVEFYTASGALYGYHSVVTDSLQKLQLVAVRTADSTFKGGIRIDFAADYRLARIAYYDSASKITSWVSYAYPTDSTQADTTYDSIGMALIAQHHWFLPDGRGLKDTIMYLAQGYVGEALVLYKWSAAGDTCRREYYTPSGALARYLIYRQCTGSRCGSVSEYAGSSGSLRWVKRVMYNADGSRAADSTFINTASGLVLDSYAIYRYGSTETEPGPRWRDMTSQLRMVRESGTELWYDIRGRRAVHKRLARGVYLRLHEACEPTAAYIVLPCARPE